MSHWKTIQEFALDNYGLVTTSQAAGFGVGPAELARWVQNGRLEKRAHGVFRLASRMPTDLDRYAESLALVGVGSRIFGESVLAMHNLAMVNPARIEVATPRRVRRLLPNWIKVIAGNVDEESELFDGIVCQPLDKAILACVGHVPSDRLLDAVTEARSQGLISENKVKELKKKLKGSSPTASSMHGRLR